LGTQHPEPVATVDGRDRTRRNRPRVMSVLVKEPTPGVISAPGGGDGPAEEHRDGDDHAQPAHNPGSTAADSAQFHRILLIRNEGDRRRMDLVLSAASPESCKGLLRAQGQQRMPNPIPERMPQRSGLPWDRFGAILFLSGREHLRVALGLYRSDRMRTFARLAVFSS